MPKIGRNQPCPCGSGKKYKHCCLDKDRAAELATLAAQQAKLAAKQAKLAAKQAKYRAPVQDEQALLLQEADELDAASNAVVDMVRAGRLDEAERAAHDLLVRYPEVHDGHDRLGMVHEARGHNREAAACYRRVVEFARAYPEGYDPEFTLHYLELIDQLDPPTPAA